MSRLGLLVRSAEQALAEPTTASIYQWIQHLDDEYSRHRYAELLPHYFARPTALEQPAKLACVSAVNALKLATKLQLHTHYRRVLAAACVTRAVNDNLSFWRRKGLKQAIWSAAFGEQSATTDSYYFSQWCLSLSRMQLDPLSGSRTLSELLAGEQRSRYWIYAEHLYTPPGWTAGSIVQQQSSGERLYVVNAENDYLLALELDAQQTRKLPYTEMHQWQLSRPASPSYKALQQLEQLSYLDNKVASLSYKAPKALLTAIRRFSAGKGALTPLIRHIQQHPVLADSLRQAAQQQSISANNPQRMDLKHVYLWLGGQRAAVTLATASLQQQFMQQRVPLQQSLMQRLSLLTILLRKLAFQAECKLPAPAALLALLSAADLFRSPRLLQATHWPEIKQLTSATKQSWVNTEASTSRQAHQRLARQLIHRWQLTDPLQPLLSPQDYPQHPLPAIMTLANLAVARIFQPQAKLTVDSRQQLKQALDCLDLTELDFRKILHSSVASSHPYSPLVELSYSAN
ncbi:hypothetical protein LG288_04665 [Idiomarina seosinensis]|uniref:hypothetical protein n=1 Tax=Idiomarina seosinensis TaxID=281739 RepID=UPI00384B451D